LCEPKYPDKEEEVGKPHNCSLIRGRVDNKKSKGERSGSTYDFTTTNIRRQTEMTRQRSKKGQSDEIETQSPTIQVADEGRTYLGVKKGGEVFSRKMEPREHEIKEVE